MLVSKFVKFLMSYLKAQVSFPSDVASIFNAIKQNCPIFFFKLKDYVLCSKEAHESANFWYFQVLRSKFVKFLMSFLKPQVSFPSDVASIFSSIKQNFLILFLAQRSCTLTKRSPLNYKFLRFSSAWVKIRQIPHVIFESTSQFSFRCCINIQCHQAKLPNIFLAQRLCTLFKRGSLKCKFLIFSSARVKICQVPHVIFKSTSLFSFRYCINIQCH